MFDFIHKYKKKFNFLLLDSLKNIFFENQVVAKLNKNQDISTFIFTFFGINAYIEA